jgi:hypothetical protein
MSLSDEAESALLALLFTNVDWAFIGDAGGLQNSAAAGVFYISLHTADPADTNSQTTSESAYTNYARVSIARATGAGGWLVTGASVANVSAITFAQCGATGSTVTHFGIGTDVSGTGHMIATGLLSAQLIISSGITPEFAVGALTCTAS